MCLFFQIFILDEFRERETVILGNIVDSHKIGHGQAHSQDYLISCLTVSPSVFIKGRTEFLPSDCLGGY